MEEQKNVFLFKKERGLLQNNESLERNNQEINKHIYCMCSRKNMDLSQPALNSFQDEVLYIFFKYFLPRVILSP